MVNKECGISTKASIFTLFFYSLMELIEQEYKKKSIIFFELVKFILLLQYKPSEKP
jgi:hypothetical protein